MSTASLPTRNHPTSFSNATELADALREQDYVVDDDLATVVHLATAPKSVGVYEAFKAAKKAAYETGSLMPPAHIRNAPTKLMKQLGYGKGYQYDPDTPEGFSGANFFPDEMERRTFYKPKGEGHEEKVKARLARWAAMRARMADQGGDA